MSERDMDIDERNAGAIGMAQQLLSDDGSGVMGPGPCADAQAEWRRMTAALSTAERERDELRQQLGSAIDVARETMTEITTGRLASIGGIENTYCPQISVSRIKKLHERLVALADSYRARVPSGGEEGRT